MNCFPIVGTGVPPVWPDIAPHLDAALGDLSESDRDAIVLRYFQKQSAADMAAALGISAEAAQKRVNRAVERLRETFSKRGVTLGAGGLLIISANAVQAAPVGLAITISATALAGTAAATTTLLAATTKTIAMTTLQKITVTATVAVLAGAGIYEARQAAQLRNQAQMLQQQQAPLAEQLRQLRSELEDAGALLAGLRKDNERLNLNTSELLNLRGEVTRLRADARGLLQTQGANSNQSTETIAREWTFKVNLLVPV